MVDETTHEEAVGSKRWITWLVGIAVFVWLAAMWGKGEHAPQMSAPVAAPAPAQPAVESAAAKIYFEAGSDTLTKESSATLKNIMDYLKANAETKAMITAFPATSANQRQAESRALAVRDMIKASGISDERILVQKPQENADSAGDSEAERVEVVVQ